MSDSPIYKVGKRLGNIADLPEELKKWLQATKIDDLEQKILDVFDELEGIANIDEIIVGLYRRFELIQERPYISNKLYRMAKSGHLKSVKGKKGIYQKDW